MSVPGVTVAPEGLDLERLGPWFAAHAGGARSVAHDLVDVPARLHTTDYAAAGLGDFGRPDGSLARNVARWGTQWQADKTREPPLIDELAVIVEGVNARFLMGTTVGDGFDEMGAKVTALLDSAYEVASRSEIRALRS